MRAMRLWVNLSLLILLNGCTSCDSYLHFAGQVRAAETGAPLAGVLVEVIGTGFTDTTDGEGNFLIEEFVGGIHTPPLRLTFAGYKPFEVTYDREDDYHRIRVRTESVSIDYDEPFYPDPNNRSTFITGTWVERFSQHYALLPDSTVYYLDIDDPTAEVREIKRQIRKLHN